MRAILDTSVLIANPDSLAGMATDISAISLAELYFGVLKMADSEERKRRTARLRYIQSHFAALPLDEPVGKVLGQLQAAVLQRGGNPRRRTADLVIAATAVVHEAVLLTNNYKDFKIVEDLVEVREPPA
jgi:predicted nucleic acid-binding protein